MMTRYVWPASMGKTYDEESEQMLQREARRRASVTSKKQIPPGRIRLPLRSNQADRWSEDDNHIRDVPHRRCSGRIQIQHDNNGPILPNR
ncbi:hypothetical protein CCHR01_00650 [Colletotrichum chrysophilum]|uniref:Uncharacterized protein n=1 Tax=Colletotrichum chrysophilum TaxID=1836956 RepID=A0AAD9EPV6_9PEZI|nr:hypothetical protein K456DRAFT_1336245 [Colletotrichum gloeosporioides 23]KAK1856680.1 hypothetical protein CCHR01_00650 [Colletotrichum chrysophilum]